MGVAPRDLSIILEFEYFEYSWVFWSIFLILATVTFDFTSRVKGEVTLQEVSQYLYLAGVVIVAPF